MSISHIVKDAIATLGPICSLASYANFPCVLLFLYYVVMLQAVTWYVYYRGVNTKDPNSCLSFLHWVELCSDFGSAHHLQAILGDIKLFGGHEETLDILFGDGQPKVLKKLVLVLDNFDQLATHCKQVSSSLL